MDGAATEILRTVRILFEINERNKEEEKKKKKRKNIFRFNSFHRKLIIG